MRYNPQRVFKAYANTKPSSLYAGELFVARFVVCCLLCDLCITIASHLIFKCQENGLERIKSNRVANNGLSLSRML